MRTHKIYHPIWHAPKEARLTFEVKAEAANKMVVGIDAKVAEIELEGGNDWTPIVLKAADFRNLNGEFLSGWEKVKELSLQAEKILRPGRGSEAKPRKMGGNWKGKAPEFRNLRWMKK